VDIAEKRRYVHYTERRKTKRKKGKGDIAEKRRYGHYTERRKTKRKKGKWTLLRSGGTLIIQREERLRERKESGHCREAEVRTRFQDTFFLSPPSKKKQKMGSRL
jgi:hypothetical protein